MIEVIPTVVPNSYEDIDVFAARSRPFTHVFHLDVADGGFAPNVTWMPAAGEKLPGAEECFYEVHLMVAHPEAAGKAFLAAGAKRLIAHVEAFESEDEASRTFASWRASGVSGVGTALLIDTPLDALEPYTIQCDSVTMMSIPRIGVQGIPFDERGYGRVADIHARYPDLTIEVDGGVGAQQIAALARAGAARFSVGSALAKSADPAAAYRELKFLAESAIQ